MGKSVDIKKIVFDLVNCSFTGHVTELVEEGLYVRYDGKSAVIAADTVPAKARGYLLLAKAIAEGKTDYEIRQKAAFSTVGPMLDVSRGGVMKVSAVKKYLEYIAALGMNMLMLYTEDTYEVEGYPFFGYQRGRYTLKELQEIDDYADSLGIEVIPCIQTLGHMEQYLRYPMAGAVRDTTRTMLVGEEATYDLIRACISTMRKAFRSNRIHIGCDEASDLGLGNYLRKNGYHDRFKLFNQHLQRVSEICKEYNYHPMMWSDVYFNIADKNRKEGYAPHVQIPQYVVDTMPDCDMVFWNYYHKDNDFYKINIMKHQSFNRKAVFAGGIWTWGGFVPNYRQTYETMKPALEECVRCGVEDVIITLWGNDGTETDYMLGNPMLCLFSEHCWQGTDCTKETIWELAAFLTGITEELADAVSDFFFRLTPGIRAGKHILWSDPLINLLFHGFDMEEGIVYLEAALAVFEKYPDQAETEYFKTVFRACLHKCRLHLQFRDRYKAGDRDWLQNFAEVTMPQIIAEFEKLYNLHYAIWHASYKTHGFERLMCRYAAAMERLRYTQETVRRYLAGEITQIEELEPELAFYKPTKGFSARDFMYIASH